MIPLPLLDGDTLLLDNSSMEHHQTCPRRAQYALCMRRRSSADKAALQFGGIMHKVMEARYLAGTPMYEQTQEVTKAMLTAAQKGFAEWTPAEDEYRNYDRMVDLILRYGERYPFEDFQIVILPDGKPAIEIPFAFPLTNIEVNADFLVQRLTKNDKGEFIRDGAPRMQHLTTIKVIWIGRIDMIYRTAHGLYVLDHKSSSMATNGAEFEISHQFYGYGNAAQLLLQQEVSATVVNRVIVRRPSRTGEAFTFERKYIPFSQALAQEWRQDVIHMVIDFIEMVRRGYMPKHTAWCVGKFGTCEYHRVCSLDSNEQRDMLLTSGDFEDNVWSPLS